MLPSLIARAHSQFSAINHFFFQSLSLVYFPPIIRNYEAHQNRYITTAKGGKKNKQQGHTVQKGIPSFSKHIRIQNIPHEFHLNNLRAPRCIAFKAWYFTMKLFKHSSWAPWRQNMSYDGPSTLFKKLRTGFKLAGIDIRKDGLSSPSPLQCLLSGVVHFEAFRSEL